jgi:AraC family transcriptional regulator
VTPLQKSVFLRSQTFTYAASTPGLPLSIKTVSNGRVLYKVGSSEITIDDDGYLIVNNKQPYTIEIASPTLVDSFVVRFPEGWAEEVYRSLTTAAAALVTDPDGKKSRSFYPRYTPHDSAVWPKVSALRANFKSQRIPDDAWLEEALRSLLASMWKSQRDVQESVARLPAARASTREEVWRRLVRGRDFIHSRSSTRISLGDAAKVACLSPFYFLRCFHSAFQVTPHQYLTQCRLKRARFLLERTELPITDVASDSGFASSASFSTAFRRGMQCSPRSWRAKRRSVPPQNRKIRKELLHGCS